eukprot:Awhi_evm1s10596
MPAVEGETINRSHNVGHNTSALESYSGILGSVHGLHREVNPTSGVPSSDYDYADAAAPTASRANNANNNVTNSLDNITSRNTDAHNNNTINNSSSSSNNNDNNNNDNDTDSSNYDYVVNTGASDNNYSNTTN